MKLNKSTFITALALGSLLTFSPGALAQDMSSTNTPPAAPAPGNMPPRRGRMLSIDQMTKMLALTDEQKTNVQTAMDDLKKKLAETRQDTSLSMEDRRAKNKEARDAYAAKMKEILTPDQYTKFQTTMMPMRRPAPSPAPAPAPTTGN